MKKLLLPIAVLACMVLPATANAAPCRNAKGQFAKCGTAAAAPAAKPAAAAPAKAGPCKDAKGKFIKCAAAPAPAMAPARKGPCKDAKGKFIKC